MHVNLALGIPLRLAVSENLWSRYVAGKPKGTRTYVIDCNIFETEDIQDPLGAIREDGDDDGASRLIALKGTFIPVKMTSEFLAEANNQLCITFLCVPTDDYANYRRDNLFPDTPPGFNVDPKPRLTHSIKELTERRNLLPEGNLLTTAFVFFLSAHFLWLKASGCQLPWIADFHSEYLSSDMSAEQFEPLR